MIVAMVKGCKGVFGNFVLHFVPTLGIWVYLLDVYIKTWT